MGCGRSAERDDYREEQARRILEGFKAIASDDKEIKTFVERLENIFRQLHEIKGQDLALTQINHRRIDGAFEGARGLMDRIMTSGLIEISKSRR